MTTAPTNPPVEGAAPSVWRRRRVLWLALLLLGLGMTAGVGIWAWYRPRVTVLQPPKPDLDGVDPAVAAIIEKERQGVLQAPRSAAAWGRFGEVLEVFNYRKDAIVCFAEAERLDPREPRWPYHQGVLLVFDNAEEAIVPLRRAAALCGDEPDTVRLRLSETLLAQGHLNEAEDGLRQLAQRDPHNPRVHLALGRLAMQRQQGKDALAHLQRAAADRRTARGATIALAELHQRQGDEEAAAEARTRLERLPPDPPWPDPFLAEIQRFNAGKRVRLMQADQLFKRGRAGEAVAMYDGVVKDYPDSSEAWFALGQALYRVRDFASAERTMQKTVELAPGFAEAHNYLGLARLEQGKLELAAASFRKATELKPDFALAYSNLGRCLLRQKDSSGALTAFRAAVRCKPSYAAAYTELAELLHQNHQDAEALKQVRQALQLNPGDDRARQLLGTLDPKGSPKHD
jgi:tetratricopeptide (TPR) repeat protein